MFWTFGEGGKTPLSFAGNRTMILCPTRSLVTTICIEMQLENLKENWRFNKITILKKITNK
jgi:hypothetical protein